MLTKRHCNFSLKIFFWLEKGGAGGPAKGLAPAHFFPLEGPAYTYEI